MTPSEFAEKKERRVERLNKRADSRGASGRAKLNRADQLTERIPMGQPILVGHHSERRHRNTITKAQDLTRSGIGELREAEELRRRAEAAETNTAISSDDPEAITKLEARVVSLKEAHEKMVAGNKAIRLAKGNVEKAVAALKALGFDAAPNKGPLFILAPRLGFVGFNLAGSTADIRRNEQRIEELKGKAVAATREPLVIGDVTITWNGDANRVQIVFPGKPSEEVRTKLKSYGFRWAPSESAWQRQASEMAWYYAKEIVTKAQQ
jgi:hypothetical protein